MNAVSKDVAAVFASFPPPAQAKLMEIRLMIYEVAKSENVGPLNETLKWGQPSYLTAPKIGSTVRLGWSEKNPDSVSAYFICTTHLVDRFREIYPNSFEFIANREIRFDLSAPLPEKELSHCLAMALTYHRNK